MYKEKLKIRYMDYLELMRVKHYIKNLLIFIPLFFNKNIFDWNKLLQACIGFVSFSIISSAVYILNDIKDLEKDRNHLKKKKRPIASGRVGKVNAIVLMIMCVIISGTLSVFGGGYNRSIFFSNIFHVKFSI